MALFKISGELKVAMASTEAVTVPVTIFGDVVGTAEVHPDGSLTATIDSSKLGEEMSRMFSTGMSDSLSFSPNIAQKK